LRWVVVDAAGVVVEVVAVQDEGAGGAEVERLLRARVEAERMTGTSGSMSRLSGRRLCGARAAAAAAALRSGPVVVEVDQGMPSGGRMEARGRSAAWANAGSAGCTVRKKDGCLGRLRCTALVGTLAAALVEAVAAVGDTVQDLAGYAVVGDGALEAVARRWEDLVEGMRSAW